MNQNDFSDNRRGRLIQTTADGRNCLAFVPDPLPPDIGWDNGLVASLTAAYQAVGELAGLARNFLNTALLIGPFIRREAVLSSRIEGTESSLIDLYAFEAGQLSLPNMQAPPENDRREVANYVTALEYGLKRLNTLPCSLRLIREVHEHLLRGVRGASKTPGEFRTVQNWIGSGGRGIEHATYVPPPVREMLEGLDAFEKYIHAQDSPHPALIRLAMIHYQFEAIHPFFDGNGRVGRLLIALLLVNWGILSEPLLYLSAFFESTRDEYYRRLLRVSQNGEMKEWVEYFLRGIAEQSRDATQRAKHLQDLQVAWRKQLTGKRVSALDLRLVDALFDYPVVRIPFVANLLGVTYQSAKNTVSRLASVGILQDFGYSAGTKLLWAPQVIAAIEEPPPPVAPDSKIGT